MLKSCYFILLQIVRLQLQLAHVYLKVIWELTLNQNCLIHWGNKNSIVETNRENEILNKQAEKQEISKPNFVINAAKSQANVKYVENWSKFIDLNANNSHNAYVIKLNRFSDSEKQI